jgi:hypothetical protein
MRLRLVPSVRIVWRHVAAAIVLAAHISSAGAWEFAHGSRDNSGFANVVTAPAGKGSVSVPGLGKFAPGAGPVVGLDGTVYIGTVEGKLIALHADGSPFWSRDLAAGQSIVTSPAISSDGSIFVIGVRKVRKAGTNAPEDVTFVATLHRFNNTGALLFQIELPKRDNFGPAAFGSPNIWRSGTAEAMMVPVYHTHPIGLTTRLVALSLEGQVLDDKVVGSSAPDTILGGRDVDYTCLIPIYGLKCIGVDYNPTRVANFLVDIPPVPNVGIFTFAGGGTPFILVSNHHQFLVGYTFSNKRLNETFRVQESGFVMRTPPMIMPNGHTLIGVEKPVAVGRIIFAGPNNNAVAPVDIGASVQAAPTRMADGKVALVDGYGKVIILKDGKLSGSMDGAGRSIASAAASRTHLFVSGEDGFVTYDSGSLAQVARFDWVGGGLHPPVIGPRGHIYAIASNILFVFPPKLKVSQTIQQPQSGLTVATNPDASAANPPEQSYAPPMTAGGNRLFACEELDQDDCGKGDHTDISLAWCQKQGYPQVKEYDVDSKKVKAETLDGRFCSKSKCKVFDQIVCAN